MRLFICAGKKFRSNNDMLDMAAGVFLDAGCSLYALNETIDLFPENAERIVFSERIPSENFDAFLSIGGDGTLLYNSQYALEEDKPILGVPGAAIHLPTTVFDVLLPQIYTGLRLTEEDLTRLGDGGLCQLCEGCHYPNCTFGRY